MRGISHRCQNCPGEQCTIAIFTLFLYSLKANYVASYDNDDHDDFDDYDDKDLNYDYDYDDDDYDGDDE